MKTVTIKGAHLPTILIWQIEKLHNYTTLKVQSYKESLVKKDSYQFSSYVTEIYLLITHVKC